MILVKAKRRKISEGQTVTYNIRGKLLKYKKVGGVMKYVGVAAKVEKRKVEKEPKLAVAKINKEQKEVLKEVGIMCKDSGALKYVKGEMASAFKAREIDYSKVPGYIKYIMMPTGTAAYNHNKIGLNMDRILELNKKYGAKMFDGVPKKIMDVFKPLKTYMEGQYKNFELAKELDKERKDEVDKLNHVKNEVFETFRDVKDRLVEPLEKKYMATQVNLYNMTTAEYEQTLELRAIVAKNLPLLADMYGEGGSVNMWLPSQYNINLVKADKILKTADKKILLDVLGKEAIAENVLKQWDKTKGKKLTAIRTNEQQKKKIVQTKRDITKAVKLEPSTQQWFEAIYNAYFVNRMLLPKVKKNPQLVTAREMFAVKDTETMRALFIQKRGQAYKTKGAREKMLSAVAEEGDERKTFSLKTVDKRTLDIVRRKMIENFDRDEHGSFGFKIHNVFHISDAQYYNEYKKLEKEIGNVRISYHGTSFGSAAKIARGGFKLGARKAGRMLGDGLYGSDKSSKSLQYVGEYFSRTGGTRGVLFVCKNAMGEVKVLNDYQVGHERCNELLEGKYDTVLAEKGTRNLKNTEWCCKNPKQFIPMLWIDVELAKSGEYN